MLVDANVTKMKYFSRTLVCAVCTLCVLTIARAHETSDILVDSSKMHEVVKSMLGFNGDPSMPHPSNRAEDLPKYMLDLYEVVKDGLNPQNKMRGNTVRSIKASIETVNGDTMFVFNMSSMTSKHENIIGAEIHLFKRRKDNYNKKSDIELILHEIAPHLSKEIGKIVVTPEVFGWQWFDVTNVVQSCVSDVTVRGASRSLGLNFRVSKPHGNTHMLHLKRYIHRNSVPYLIIYSNDPQNIDIDELEQLSTKRGNKLTSSKVQNIDTIIPTHTVRSKRSLSDNSADPPIFQSRARSMSILTNEIPEDPEDYNRPYPIKVKEKIQTHPGMLQTRKESRHKITDPKIIPYPGDYVEKRRKDKRKNKRRKGKGRRKNKLELPKAWDDLRELAEEDATDSSCSKKKLIVSFDEIGWGEWIISPKSFKSHYCSGTCSFPLTKKMRPSNHATIQSLVHAVGIYPDVPAPCCVPDKLSSITLLYFDEHRNVILKNYPNMTVQKCACR